ncbi:MAG: BMP family ABC transporter substrate-binding protein [Clostridia bacterium]|jgi:basic membrane protein A|nr:BMP family ABC transporter substrate-binding protein [Clostridia bacterium]
MKATKKIAVVILLITMVFSLAACGGNSQPGGEGEPQGQQESKMRVAMVFSGPVNDNSWNGSGYAGLKKIEEGLGVEIAFSDQVPVPEFEEAFRDYASKGYDLIIGHGGEFSDAAAAVAEEFPEVHFSVVNGNKNAANLSTFEVCDEEVAFLAGVAAGLTTQSNIVSGIGGMEIPPTYRSLEGFKSGVLYVNPEAQVLHTYTGNFEDAAKAKEAALAHLEKGADVVFYYLNAASPGVIQAAQEKNAKAIATITDQYEQAPETILTSALSDLSQLVYLIGEKFQAGELKGESYAIGVAYEEIAGLAPFRGQVPEEVEAKVAEIKQDLIAGKIQVLPQ